jgi:integrase
MRPERQRGDGYIYQRGARWWICFYHAGRKVRQPGGATEKAAGNLLRRRLAEVRTGQFIGDEERRVRVDDLVASYRRHLALRRGGKSLRSFDTHVAPILRYLKGEKALSVTTARLETYQGARLEQGRARGTVNREVHALRACYRLAEKQRVLSRLPHFPTLTEDNRRTGFLSAEEVAAVAANLPHPLDDLVRFAFRSAWRRGEIVGLRWSSVDRAAGEIRLATSKSGYPRVLPLVGELAEIVERAWTSREYARIDGTPALADHVFHHDDGSPIGDFRKAWFSACRKAGIGRRLFHDLRRSGIRQMVMAGVDTPTIMSLSGHRTTSVFLRYAIVGGNQQRDALARAEAYVEAGAPKPNVASIKGKGARQ